MVATSRSSSVPVNELLNVVPRFLDRTSQQVDVSRVLLGHIPCIGERMMALGIAKEARSAQPGPHGTSGEHGTVDTPDPSVGLTPSDSGQASAVPEPQDTIATPRKGRGKGPASTPSGPVQGDLAIPEYDSLAASQVIPRLEMLKANDLEHILAYEESNRNRQTIIHKVGQLLASNSGE